MKVSNLVLGPLNNNCYFLEIDDEVIIIDPAKHINKIKNKLGEKNLVAIFVTHYHFDHVGALKNLQNKYDVPIYDYKKEEKNYKLNKFDFDIIYNPGHSKDSVSFYFKNDNLLFSGDFIFKDDIGRCDLEGGDYEEMLKSIDKIKKYEDFIIYPGHGEITTLSYEKKYNPYFK